MKKILLLLLITVILSPTQLFAAEYESASSDEVFDVSPDDFIPDNVQTELDKIGVNAESESILEGLLSLVLKLLQASISKLIPEISAIFLIILISSFLLKIIDNSTYIKIISFASCIFISYKLISVFSYVILETEEALTGLSEILNGVIPSFCSVLLLGGGTFSAMAASASLGCVLSILKFILSDVLTPAVFGLFALIIIEKLSPSFADMRLSSSIKKYFMMILSFVTTIMLTVISFQNILAASKDSVSARALKFTASSFIPIVGGAVAESLKTVIAGIKYLKSTVGISVALSIFSVMLPIICTLFSMKLLLGFISFSGGLCGAVKEKELIDSFVNIVDILIGIIICTSILSILMVVLFVVTSFNLVMS